MRPTHPFQGSRHRHVSAGGPQSKMYRNRPVRWWGEGTTSMPGLTRHIPRAGVDSGDKQSQASQGASRIAHSHLSQQGAVPRARTAVGIRTPTSHSKWAAPAWHQRVAGKLLPQILMCLLLTNFLRLPMATRLISAVRQGFSKLHVHHSPSPMDSWDDWPFPESGDNTGLSSLQNAYNSYLLALKTPMTLKTPAPMSPPLGSLPSPETPLLLSTQPQPLAEGIRYPCRTTGH